MLGVGAGVAAILVALVMRVGAQPQSLLYSNLDLKEASQITAALDQSGVKYEVKGDGSTIMVPRDVVATTRLMLSSKGLPTSGSVGYEIFDNAPALGQTDFVQTLNRQRALEGELARTIRSIRGVTAARVHLVLPKRQLFEEETESPSASIMVAVSGRGLVPEQVRAIRNLTAGAVPDLKPDRVTLVDEAGELLAGGEGGDGGSGAAAAAGRSEAEEKIRKTVKDLVEGVVGAGKARVQVTADLDLSRVTVSEEKFDPDGQVVRSTQTGSENANESKPGSNNAVSASQNIPGAAPAAAAGAQAASTSGRNDETTNYEISKTTRTEVTEPGTIKKISVAVAVDGVTAPAGKDGKPGAYSPRPAAEMQRIEQLVRSAVGFDQQRGDQVTVVNVRFDRPSAVAEGVTASSPFSFDKNDLMRGVELAVMLAVAVLLVLFVVRPMLKPGTGGGMGGPVLALASAAAGGHGGQMAIPGGGAAGGMTALDPATGAQMALPGPSEMDQRIDIARIEGQVKASSVKKVAEFVEKHPEESVSILRSWLHES
ncbi:MAG TPA: flagellar basal-body MS-ring/collar protein FliF [Caulobacteraceae bacterium]|nr:flagellar basal-body MS-ring/collar protein FliF [Caulobacteraceae bacterium]